MPDVLVEKLGWILLHSLWQGVLIGLLTAAGLYLLRHLCANIRYIVAFTALILMLVIPVLTVCCGNNNTTLGLDSMQIRASQQSAPIEHDRDHRSAGKFRQAARPESRMELWIRRLDRSLPVITGCWAVGLMLVSLWHGVGYWRVRRWIRQGTFELDVYRRGQFQVLLQRAGIRQIVRIMQTHCLDVPAVVGAIKPVVLIPASLLTGMDREALEAIVLHEMIHIRRYDYLMNIVQTVIETLMFYHPMIWWLSGTIRQEREHCCDDVAVRILGDEVVYVKSLVHLEEMRHRIRMAVAADGGDLFHRIRRLMAGSASRIVFQRANPVVFTLLCFLSLAIFVQPVFAHRAWVGQLLFGRKELPVHLELGLAARYPMDGSAEDISGHDNHGRIDGEAKGTMDRFGQANGAMAFDGIDDQIRVAASDSLNIAGSLTVSCWVKPMDKTYYQAWVSKANDEDAHSQWRIGCGQFYDFEWGFTQYTQLDQGSSNYQDFWVTGCNIQTGIWTHVVATVDQEQGLCHLYVNGRQVATFEGVSPFTLSNDPLYIGFQLDNHCYFSGDLDDLRIYSRVLNPREIWTLCHEASR